MEPSTAGTRFAQSPVGNALGGVAWSQCGRTADVFELMRFGGVLQVNDWLFDSFRGELGVQWYALTSAIVIVGGGLFMQSRYRKISL